MWDTRSQTDDVGFRLGQAEKETPTFALNMNKYENNNQIASFSSRLELHVVCGTPLAITHFIARVSAIHRNYVCFRSVKGNFPLRWRCHRATYQKALMSIGDGTHEKWYKWKYILHTNKYTHLFESFLIWHRLRAHCSVPISVFFFFFPSNSSLAIRWNPLYSWMEFFFLPVESTWALSTWQRCECEYVWQRLVFDSCELVDSNAKKWKKNVCVVVCWARDIFCFFSVDETKFDGTV